MVFIEGGRPAWKRIFGRAVEIAGVLWDQYSDVQDPDNPLIG